ncbi:MAG: hypothetical protein AABY07_02965 [Nanoarchaeota archaeon]
MTDSKFTPDGLPIISQDIIDILKRDYAVREKSSVTGIYDYQIEILTRIADENPQLYQVFEEYFEAAQDTPEDSLMDKLAGIFVITYESFRRQTEANKLEEQNLI